MSLIGQIAPPGEYVAGQATPGTHEAVPHELVHSRASEPRPSTVVADRGSSGLQPAHWLQGLQDFADTAPRPLSPSLRASAAAFAAKGVAADVQTPEIYTTAAEFDLLRHALDQIKGDGTRGFVDTLFARVRTAAGGDSTLEEREAAMEAAMEAEQAQHATFMKSLEKDPPPPPPLPAEEEAHVDKMEAQLLLGLKKLLKHLDRRPPQGCQPLATAVLTALLAEEDDEDAEPSEDAGSAVGAAKGDAVEEVPEPVPDTAGEEPEPPPDTPTFDAAAEASESSLKIFAVEKGGEANEDKNPPDTHQVRT